MQTLSNFWLIVDLILLASAAVAASLAAISLIPQDAEQ